MRRGRDGVILLETLVSLVFIALCLSAISGLVTTSIDRIREARSRARAVMLAETMFSELQLGLIDTTEGSEGEFEPAVKNYWWSYELEPTEVTEIQRLTLTIHCIDPEFELTTVRYFSPALNYSYEQMKQIAADPSGMQTIEDEGMKELLTMVSETGMPGGEQLVQALMAGGVNEMMRIYSKLTNMDFSEDEAMSMLEQFTSGGGAMDSDGMTSMMAKGGDVKMYGEAWSNADTTTGKDALADAGEGEGATSQPGEEGTTTQQSEQTADGTQEGQKGGQGTSREQAMQRILQMMGRMRGQK